MIFFLPLQSLTYRSFIFSRKTSLTQRERPQPDADTTPPSSSFPSKKHGPRGDDTLPEGWAMEYTDTGRAYYVDLKTLKTTWADPRLDGKR